MSRLSDWLLGRPSARAAAHAEGLETGTVYREFPSTKDRGKTYSMQRIKCVQYRLGHRVSTDLRWRFLMRHGANDLARGYRLEVEGGAMPAAVQSALQELAADPSVELGGELFEFEGDANGVSVFWAEWGGEKMVVRLTQHLRRLSHGMADL